MGKLAGIARREKKRAPMEMLQSAAISTRSGVANDFRGKPGGRQVTLLSSRAWLDVCAELDMEIPWTMRRSNLLIEDLDLPGRAGQIVAIGDVRLRTTMEIAPCSRMDEQIAGLKKALSPAWRGGIGCQVLQSGTVGIGDTVRLVEAGE